MTVRDLIEQLQEEHPDSEVVIEVPPAGLALAEEGYAAEPKLSVTTTQGGVKVVLTPGEHI